MGVFTTVKTEIVAIGSMVMIIVILSIVLLKFKDVSGVTTGLNTTIDNTVNYIDEPITWISIVIVAIVGIVLVKWFTKSKM